MVSQVIAVAIFVAVIGVIVSEKLHRAACALIGAMLLILIGILEPKEALGFIDFNTIGVLIGMMMFVAVVKNSGIFEFLAIKSAKIAKGNPWRIMIAFMIITAVLSAFLDNVTTVLLIGPMTFSICQKLELNPVPYLMTQIMASNLGGTATLIGDPPNIMIGSAADISFAKFVVYDGSNAAKMVGFFYPKENQGRLPYLGIPNVNPYLTPVGSNTIIDYKNKGYKLTQTEGWPDASN